MSLRSKAASLRRYFRRLLYNRKYAKEHDAIRAKSGDVTPFSAVVVPGGEESWEREARVKARKSYKRNKIKQWAKSKEIAEKAFVEDGYKYIHDEDADNAKRTDEEENKK